MSVRNSAWFVVLARDGSRICTNELIPAVLLVVTAVSRSGDDGDSHHAGLVYIDI